MKKAVRWVKQRNNELPTIRRHYKRRALQKNNKKINKGKIVVVFICQYIPSWSKDKQLYEALSKDKRFKVVLLCIPNRIHAHRLDDCNDLSNETYEYFDQHGYPEIVNALNGDNSWYDLRGLHPDYVIYHRYDLSMPFEYTSTVVSSYAKVCLIRYGYPLVKFGETMIDQTFGANTYCYFAETNGIKKEFIRWNSILCKLKLSKAVYCGVPGVENAYKAKDDICETWDFSKNSFRCIYAPRWTEDLIWGGSSFMKYREAFFNLADSHPDIDFLIRPHPLMFDHFINTGTLSKEDIKHYEDECSARPNMGIDHEKEYLSTFWNSSVLICDYTSMIIEYYITEKPIIYLTYDESLDYTETMSAMLSGCYIVNGEDELSETLENLFKEKDPLLQRRKEVCRQILTEDDSIMVSDKMKRILINDYNR